MIISLNWLKQFIDIDMSIDELKELIGARLVEVESVEYIGEKYKDALIVKAVDAKKIEGSDHLSLIKINDGGVLQEIERDENGYIQVVCGAPNIKTGQTVVWLPPESIVPETFNEIEPFRLGIRKIRGQASYGMIASAKELAISDDHQGILVLDDRLVPGTSFSAYLELDDYLLNIENKSLTNRPDCFGVIGFAREVSAITGQRFASPNWLLDYSKKSVIINTETEIEVDIKDSNLCPRYMAVAMAAVDGTIKSPLKIQSFLSRVGIRPISAIVDVTNYLMMLTGQPLHAFDYDKVLKLNNKKAKINVRQGVEGEKLELLSGKAVTVAEGDIVIATDKSAIGLAGAMGGANSEIDENTKRIIIESASFNLYNLRSTQMRHGIFSEAITRFTKGQSPEIAEPVMNMAIKLMTEWAGAVQISDVSDSYPKKFICSKVTTSASEINSILGSDYSEETIVETLKNIEFIAELINNQIFIQAPYWRSDIHISEDVIEDVGRLNGFDNIAPSLPRRDFVAVYPNSFDEFRVMTKKALVRSGANEVLTYSFTHGDVIAKALQDTQNSYRLVNSISPDLQYYRQTLMPSLLGLVNMNIKQGISEFALVEFNKVHQKKFGLNNENVPNEKDFLAAVYASKVPKNGASFYQVKNMLDFVFNQINLELDYEELTEADFEDVSVLPFEVKKSAKITSRHNSAIIGYVGEYKKSVAKAFKLPDYSAGFEINMRLLFDLYNNSTKKYRPISRFPAIERDMCFQVVQDVNYARVKTAIEMAIKALPYEVELSPVDIYSKDASISKNITVRIKIVSHDHTLTNDDANDVADVVKTAVIAETNASII